MRFIFPVEFKKYIPAPFKNIKESDITVSEETDSELRGKVIRIVSAWIKTAIFFSNQKFAK